MYEARKHEGSEYWEVINKESGEVVDDLDGEGTEEDAKRQARFMNEIAKDD